MTHFDKLYRISTIKKKCRLRRPRRLLCCPQKLIVSKNLFPKITMFFFLYSNFCKRNCFRNASLWKFVYPFNRSCESFVLRQTTWATYSCRISQYTPHIQLYTAKCSILFAWKRFEDVFGWNELHWNNRIVCMLYLHIINRREYNVICVFSTQPLNF